VLSPAERVAGRAFRDHWQATLRERHGQDPPTHDALAYLAVFRHGCAARHGASTAIALKEVYHLSPAYVIDDGHVPAGRFAFIYKEGRCQHCQATVRSAGRLVDAWERPPLHGRPARQ
jgi:hypothetical protein